MVYRNSEMEIKKGIGMWVENNNKVNIFLQTTYINVSSKIYILSIPIPKTSVRLQMHIT